MSSLATKLAIGVLLAGAGVAGTAASAGAAVTDQRYVAHYAGISECASQGGYRVQQQGPGAYWNQFACYAAGNGYDLYLQHNQPPAPVWTITDSVTIGPQPTITACVNAGLARTNYNNPSSYWNQFACPAAGAGYTLILQHGQYV